jgi:hypothetical protein
VFDGVYFVTVVSTHNGMDHIKTTYTALGGAVCAAVGILRECDVGWLVAGLEWNCTPTLLAPAQAALVILRACYVGWLLAGLEWNCTPTLLAPAQSALVILRACYVRWLHQFNSNPASSGVPPYLLIQYPRFTAA